MYFPTKQKLFVLAGPAKCGNVFGYADRFEIPAGSFVIVSNGEYTDGGVGPSVYFHKLFKSVEAAVQWIEIYAR